MTRKEKITATLLKLSHSNCSERRSLPHCSNSAIVIVQTSVPWISVQRTVVSGPQGAARFKADHLNAVYGVRMLQHGRVQQAVVVHVMGQVADVAAVRGLRHVQLGMRPALQLVAHASQHCHQEEDDASAHAQDQVQNGPLLVTCPHRQPSVSSHSHRCVVTCFLVMCPDQGTRISLHTHTHTHTHIHTQPCM